jgi:hypothetical protein
MAKRGGPGARRAVAVVIVGLATFAAGWLYFLRPWLEQPREVKSGTPVPTALFNLSYVPLKRGQEACLSDVSFGTDAEAALFNATTGGRPGPRLRISANAVGYRFHTTVPAGWGDRGGLTVPMRPPTTSVRGTFCIANAGRHGIGLYGTDEGDSLSRPQVRIDGRPIPTDVSLSFDQAKARPVSGRLGEIFGHMMAFTWGPLGTWFAWILAGALVVGVPVGTLLGLAAAVRADARMEADDDPRPGS